MFKCPNVYFRYKWDIHLNPWRDCLVYLTHKPLLIQPLSLKTPTLTRRKGRDTFHLLSLRFLTSLALIYSTPNQSLGSLDSPTPSFWQVQGSHRGRVGVTTRVSFPPPAQPDPTWRLRLFSSLDTPTGVSESHPKLRLPLLGPSPGSRFSSEFPIGQMGFCRNW